MKYQKLPIWISICLICILPQLSLATNGNICFHDPINTALAGSNVASPQDAMSSATNPANLVFIKKQIDIGAGVFSPHRHYTATGAGNVAVGRHDSQKNYHPTFNFGYSKPINNTNVVGILAYSYGGMCTDYSSISNVFGRGEAGINLRQMFLNFAYAHKFANKLSLGASLLAVGQSMNAKGLGAFAPFTVTGSTTNLTNEGDDFSGGIGIMLGVHFDVAPNMQLAATYQPKITMTKFKKYSNLFAQGGSFDIPPMASIGIAWQLVPSTIVTASVKKVWYSAIPAISNPIENLGKGSVDRSYYLGGKNGAGFGWKDLTIFSIGEQWQANADWTWRAGYSYAKQPIKPSQVVFNILAPAVTESHFSLGTTKNIHDQYLLTIYGLLVPPKSVTGTNYFASGQTITLSMYQYQLGFGWSWLK